MSIGVSYHGMTRLNIGNFWLELKLNLPSDLLPGALLESALVRQPYTAVLCALFISKAGNVFTRPGGKLSAVRMIVPIPVMLK